MSTFIDRINNLTTVNPINQALLGMSNELTRHCAGRDQVRPGVFESVSCKARWASSSHDSLVAACRLTDQACIVIDGAFEDIVAGCWDSLRYMVYHVAPATISALIRQGKTLGEIEEATGDGGCSVADIESAVNLWMKLRNNPA